MLRGEGKMQQMQLLPETNQAERLSLSCFAKSVLPVDHWSQAPAPQWKYLQHSGTLSLLSTVVVVVVGADNLIRGQEASDYNGSPELVVNGRTHKHRHKQAKPKVELTCKH